MATIRTADGIRFQLRDSRMVQTNTKDPYYAYRHSIREALETKNSRVQYFWTNGDPESETYLLGEAYGWLFQGVTQRNKKFLSIGCMRFVGKERIKLIKWAKKRTKRESE